MAITGILLKSGWTEPKEAAQMLRNMIFKHGLKLFRSMREKREDMRTTACFLERKRIQPFGGLAMNLDLQMKRRGQNPV